VKQPPLNEPLKTDSNGKITSTPWNQWFNTVQKTSASITHANTGVPTTPPAKVGDIHVDTANKTIYVGVNNQSNSGWVTGLGGGTVGPQGPQGPQGPAGPQGPTGSSGGITPGGTGFAHVTSSTLDPTARNPVLASSDFLNQGTTTTVLHGNASGNPSWGSIFTYYTISATVGSSPTIAVDWNNGGVQGVLLGHTGTATITLSSGIPGGTYRLILQQSYGGGNLVNYSITGVKWVFGILPIQTLTMTKKDILTFIYDGTDYLGEWAGNF
jgi:hypothetical protein